MYQYLDNQSNDYDPNDPDAPNENYARELLELHTLGLNGAYTEGDVNEVARCFTGMKYEANTMGGNYGEFKYVSTKHDPNQKTVLGELVAAGQGVNDVFQVADILARHPDTKATIAYKLIQWLLEDVPDPQLLSDVITAYGNKGDISAMVRTILTEANIDRASLTPRFRTGFDWYAAMVRASNPSLTLVDIRGIKQALNAIQHVPFFWSPPDGYPQDKEYWAPNQITRWRMASEALHPVNTPDYLMLTITDIFSGVGGLNVNQAIQQINTIYAHGTLSASDIQGLRDYVTLAFQGGPPVTDDLIRELISLAVFVTQLSILLTVAGVHHVTPRKAKEVCGLTGML